MGKRRAALMRKWLSILLCFAFLILVGVLSVDRTLLPVEQAREYSDTEFYTDTGFIPTRPDGDEWRYGKIDGRLMMVWSRGKPHSTVSTAHGWYQTLSIEFPSRPKPGTHDLQKAEIRIGYISYYGRTWWVIGEKGVGGNLKIISRSDNMIRADYDITVNAFDRLGEKPRNEDFHYNGKAKFFRRRRPDSDVHAADGRLFCPLTLMEKRH